MHKITDFPGGSRDLEPKLATAGRQLKSEQALPGSSNAPHLPEPRFKLLGSAELRALLPIEWLIRDILPTKGVATLYGPSASGKTFLVFDMAAAIAEGTRWFGFRVAAAPVALIVLEGEAGLPFRAAAWEEHNQRKLPKDMHIVLQPFKLTSRKDVQDMAAVVPAGAVIFIDTLNRAAPTIDENSSKDRRMIAGRRRHACFLCRSTPEVWPEVKPF